MKRAYESPEMCWMPVCSSDAVADVCWAYAKNGKPFYYNTFGKGYAELYAMGSCSKNVYFEIQYMPEDMSAEDKKKADDEMQRVIAQVMATMPNKPTNYKGSVFSPSVDSDWS